MKDKTDIAFFIFCSWFCVINFILGILLILYINQIVGIILLGFGFVMSYASKEAWSFIHE